MKKVLLAIIALFVLSFNQVQAHNLNNLSDDYKIISALNVLQNMGSNDVISRLEKSSTKIMFYDLSLISYSYAKHFAIASTDENGENYILINQKFQSSPKEALACLIAHESVHQLPQATLEEEVMATTVEAQHWIKLQGNVKSNVKDELVARLDKLENMYEASTSSQNLIRISISNNSFYQQQLAMQ